MKPLKKALPPKLAYRFRKWMMQFPGAQAVRQQRGMQAQKSEMPMKKHETAISFYKSDVVKMDFGPEVDPKTKKMALEWAKKRGLNVVESGLSKSQNGYESYTFAKNQVDIFGENPLKTIIF